MSLTTKPISQKHNNASMALKRIVKKRCVQGPLLWVCLSMN